VKLSIELGSVGTNELDRVVGVVDRLARGVRTVAAARTSEGLQLRLARALVSTSGKPNPPSFE
jgi:hypothetical protein